MNQELNILNPNLYQLKLTDGEFNRLSSFIRENYGIKILPVKKTMLQGRLYKRLRTLNMNSFGEYINYLFSIDGLTRETPFMINEVSTNKTDFFREPVHFDYLTNNILPALERSDYINRPFRVWSAGCSSGEEPYTLAMVLEEFRAKNPWFQYQIKGTDISTKVLEAARSGIYKKDKILPVPVVYREKYLLKGKDKNADLVRIIPELRQRVYFDRLNFMDDYYKISESFDIIFCRNVLIYFDIETQEQIICKLCRQLTTEGILFLGHSESITRMRVPLQQIKPTIFNKI